MYRKVLKPVADFLIALTALLLLSPLFLVVTIAIRLDSKGSAFFLQERLGLHGQVFKVYKFRSMSQG